MPKPILKKATSLLLATVCLSVVIINSCKKDSHTNQQNTVSDPVIAQAKSWYESTFPTGTKLSTQAVSGNKDLNQVISPDWQHGDTYTKLSAAVIEMPLDPAHTLASVLKDPAKNISYNNKTNSRSSFLVLKDSSGYHACIMTLIGDPTYLGNDPGKLAKSTYRKYDPAFSGLVLYFTPQGQYLNGYKYQNGHLIIPAQAQDNQSKLKVNEASALFLCTDYYVDTYVNDQQVDTHYAYTECVPISVSGGGGGGGPSGGGAPPGGNPGTGGNNPGTTTPTPPITDPCAPKGGQPVVESTRKLGVQQVNPDPSVPINPDGSFPPPNDTPPCNKLVPTTPVTVTITNSDIANSTPIDDGKPAIDPAAYVKCFTDGKIASGYRMTIYVQQPIPGKSDQYQLTFGAGFTNGEFYTTPGGTTLDVGHTFVGFEKDNTDGTKVTQVMGFYPTHGSGVTGGSSAGLSSPAKIEDNSGHSYNVSYTVNVTASQFKSALQGVVSSSTSKYTLSSIQSDPEHNCTDAALSWMGAAGIVLPTGNGRGPFVNDPGDFGQALSTVNGVSTTSGTAPQSHGACN